jgi:hypothetical protein
MAGRMRQHLEESKQQAARIEDLVSVCSEITPPVAKATATRGWIVWQDKLFEQSVPQLRGNRLPVAASSHSDAPENWTLAYPETAAENPALGRVSGKSDGS